MIKFWRFLSVSIVVAVCLGLLLVPAVVGVPEVSAQPPDPPAGKATLRLPAAVTVLPGETFLVNVTIYNPNSVCMSGAMAAIRWNGTMLSANDITPGASPNWPGYPGGLKFIGADNLTYDGAGSDLDPYRNTDVNHAIVNFTAGSTKGVTTVFFCTDGGAYKNRVTVIRDTSPTPVNVLDWGSMQNMTVTITGLQTLTVNVTPNGTGTVKANGVTLTGYPNDTNWNASDNVTLEAFPVAGWDFVNWTGNISGPANATLSYVIMDADKSVTANFVELTPELDVDPDSLSLTVAPDATDTDTYTVTNIGGGNLSWNSSNVTYDPNGNMSWLSQNITSGNLTANASDTVLVTANATGLELGTYNATINITGNSSVPLIVTLTVGIPGLPEIAFSPESFTFFAAGGAQPTDQTLEIWNSGTGILNWSLTDNAGWLSENPTSGSSTGEHDSVTVSARAPLVEGDYHATITITAPGAANTPQSVPVTLRVVTMPVGPAQLSASALDISPQQVEPGQEVTISISVANTGGETGSYNAVLYINGVVEDSQTVSVAGGISKNVIFTVTKSQAGVYDVSLAGQNGQFEVVSTGWFGGGLGTGGIIAIVVVVIVLIVAVVFILRGTARPE